MATLADMEARAPADEERDEVYVDDEDDAYAALDAGAFEYTTAELDRHLEDD